MSEFEKHVIGDVHDIVVEGPDPAFFKTVFQPLGRIADCHPGNRPSGVSVAQIRIEYLHGDAGRSRCARHFRIRHPERQAEDGSDLPRNPQYAQAVRPVGSYIDLKDNIVSDSIHALYLKPGHGKPVRHLLRGDAAMSTNSLSHSKDTFT